MKHLIAAIMVALSLMLIVLAINAWQYAWTTGVVVTGIVGAVLLLGWSSVKVSWSSW